MSKKIKGKCSYKHCKKVIFYYFKEGRERHFCNQQCYWKSLKGKPSHKKGCKLSDTAKKKVSKGLKKYHRNGGTVWNKGKQLVKIRKDKKYYRQNPEYYLKELEQNAIRRKIKEYGKDPKRIEQVKKQSEYYQNTTGAGRKRKIWTIKEIEYLQSNYEKTDFLTMALHLNRSWAAVSHKINRLKLRKNYKWT